MSLSRLRQEVFEANLKLVEYGLVTLTWGNASGIDRANGVVLIKPSGVSYATMRPADLVAVDLDGKTVDGTLRPSSDMPTHIALYRAWPGVGGVVHTHSVHGTAFAQACRPIPCLGTTHADYCPGEVPCIRALTQDEVEADYEANTGQSIIDHFQASALNPLEYTGAVLAHHGPFAWGRTPLAAADSALILESVARMALLTAQINPSVPSIPGYITQKHHLRKHGPNAYYGQTRG